MARAKFERWLTPEGLIRIEGWARDGLVDTQISHNMGISKSTLNAWKNQFPEIYDALKRGKEVVDLEVENALLKRALGYEYVETSIKEGPTGTEIKKTTRMVVPDVTAQIFWLKNRRPDKWRDKVAYTDDTELEKLDELIAGIEKAVLEE